jgi:hypothetical protein
MINIDYFVNCYMHLSYVHVDLYQFPLKSINLDVLMTFSLSLTFFFHVNMLCLYDVLHLQDKYLMIEMLTLLWVLVCYCEVGIL